MQTTNREKRGFKPNRKPENFGYKPSKAEPAKDKPAQKSESKPIPPKGSETIDA